MKWVIRQGETTRAAIAQQPGDLLGKFPPSGRREHGRAAAAETLDLVADGSPTPLAEHHARRQGGIDERFHMPPGIACRPRGFGGCQ